MPDFVPYAFDLAAARRELTEFQQLLDSSADLSERDTLLPFLRGRRQIVAQFARYNPTQNSADRVAWEYPMPGGYRCDFVAGDSRTGVYTFVECESAQPGSVFVQRRRRVSEWSPRFERGYSQIIDWLTYLHGDTHSPDIEARFGRRPIWYTAVLVVGRDAHLTPGERHRLDWRRDYVVVDSRKIVCVTYDRLAADLDARLTAMEEAHPARNA